MTSLKPDLHFICQISWLALNIHYIWQFSYFAYMFMISKVQATAMKSDHFVFSLIANSNYTNVETEHLIYPLSSLVVKQIILKTTKKNIATGETSPAITPYYTYHFSISTSLTFITSKLPSQDDFHHLITFTTR